MSGLRTALRQIGGPSAISWPALVVALIFTAALLVTDGIGSTDLGDIPARLAIVAVSVSVMFAMLLLLRRAVLRDVTVRPRPGRTLLVFVAGAALRGVVVALLLEALAGVTTSVAFRVTASILTIVPVLALTAVVVDRARLRAGRRAALRDAADRLRAAEQVAQAEIEAAHAATIVRIREMLTRAVKEAAAATPALAVDRLRSEVDQVIRPLSHRLAMTVPTWGPRSDADVVGDVAWRGLWRDIGRGDPFSPVLVAALGVVMSAAGSIVRFGPAIGMFAALTIGVGILATAQVGKVLVAPWLTRLDSASARLLVFVAAAVAAGVAVAALLAGTLALVGKSSPALVIPVVVVTPIVFALVAVAQTVGVALREIEAELEATTIALDRAIARVHQVAWQQQRLLALAVHGPLQAKVSSAAIRLEQAVVAGTATDQAVDDALRSVLSAIDQLDLMIDEGGDLQVDLADVAEAWEGVCDVTIDLDAALVARIGADPVSARCVVDVFTEACSNAVRHGRARSVALAIGEDDEGLLCMRICDDGRSTEEQASGLGSRLLDEIAVRWERRRNGDRTELEVLLPALADHEGTRPVGVGRIA